jgi:hypothetical protein
MGLCTFCPDELHYEFIIGKLTGGACRCIDVPCRGQVLDSGASLVAQMLEQDVA